MKAGSSFGNDSYLPHVVTAIGIGLDWKLTGESRHVT